VAKPKPRAKQVLAKARSFRRGTLAPKTLVELAKLVKRPGLREMASAMEDFDGDALLWEGELVVDGDFRTSDAGAIWLVVRGDLVVSGLYEDTCNDAPDHVFIEGSLRAADVITAGNLDIRGDLRATGSVIGDYNDGGMHVRGDVHARLFGMFDHPFRVDGKVRADYVLWNQQLGDEKPPKGETPFAKLPLAGDFTVNDLVPRLRKRLPLLR
jgi:predicted acyltransferase (DUF342 family)